jgi:hypothetical protein
MRHKTTVAIDLEENLKNKKIIECVHFNVQKKLPEIWGETGYKLRKLTKTSMCV